MNQLCSDPPTTPQPAPRWPDLRELTLQTRRDDEDLGHAIDELRFQVMALEEILAAPWPRVLLLLARLRSDLRASVRHSEGAGFAERRLNAIGTGWLARPGAPR